MNQLATVAAKPFAWSYSHIKNFETCPKRYYHVQVAKDVAEEESPQLAEGNALHAAFDLRIRKKTPLPLEYAAYEPMLAKWLAAPGRISSESKLAITSTFAPTQYFARDAWLRVVIDTSRIDGSRATLLDWKTGRPDRLADDATQLTLTALAVFIHMPAVTNITAAFVVVNYNDRIVERYTRTRMTEYWNDILPRVRALQAAKAGMDFPPKPGGLCRRYCPVTACPHHGIGSR